MQTSNKSRAAEPAQQPNAPKTNNHKTAVVNGSNIVCMQVPVQTPAFAPVPSQSQQYAVEYSRKTLVDYMDPNQLWEHYGPRDRENFTIVLDEERHFQEYDGRDVLKTSSEEILVFPSIQAANAAAALKWQLLQGQDIFAGCDDDDEVFHNTYDVGDDDIEQFKKVTSDGRVYYKRKKRLTFNRYDYGKGFRMNTHTEVWVRKLILVG